jgi:putative membrane protein
MKSLRNETTPHAKNIIIFALCTAVALSIMTAFADDEKAKGAPASERSTATGKTSHLSRGDEHFIKEACAGGHMEVRMGKLGVQKAQSTEVKQLAQRLIDDHTKAGTELTQIASNKGLTLTDKDTIANTVKDNDRTHVRDNEDAHKGHDKELGKLESLSGSEFDRAFAKMAVKDHEKDVKLFEKASQNADDSEVKAFAAKTLPTLREHLQQAKSLETSAR